MENFSIAPIQPAQIEETANLIVRAFRDAGDPDISPDVERRYLSALFNKAAAIDGYKMLGAFVALDPAGAVIGAVECGTWQEDEADENWSNAYWMTSLAVDPAWQKKGLGDALLHRVEKYVADDLLKGEPGQLCFTDATKKANPESRFYEHRGYTAYDEWDGKPLMSRDLNTPRPHQ